MFATRESFSLMGALSKLPLVSIFLSATSLSNAFPVAPTTHNISSGDIEWTSCPEELPSNLQCANYTVPLDWGNPSDKETVFLSMVKLAANDTANRIGNIFVNPGGPGGPAISTVTAFATGNSYLGEEVRARFDIIGVDPRGIGRSTPVKCDREIWNERISLFPSNEEEYEALVDHNRRAGDSCRELSGSLIDFMDTASVVRDYEAVRKAIGGEPMNWLGFSYGTQIGSQYAELFPNNYRTIVLDGNLQHSQSESSNLLIESTAYENELHRFFDWCDGNSTCAIHSSNTTAAKSWDNLLNKATKTPIPAIDCDDTDCRSDVTAEEIRFAVDGLVTRSPMSWPLIGQALSDALAGNATILSGYNPIFVGESLTPNQAASTYGFVSVICQDWTHATRSYGELQNKMAAGAIYAPRTKGVTQTWQIQTQCLGWPTKLTNPPHELKIPESAPKILLANSYYDPSTSYVWGTGMRDEIPQRVMVSRNGDGHTNYRYGGKTARVIDKYLVTGEVPPDGTVFET